MYDAKTPGCPGGKRYKKSPELVNEFLDAYPIINAPGKYLVFKRWDKLDERDDPVVVFYAKPDVLSGLFTLANYDLAGAEGVVAPMGAGYATILQYPLQEARSEQPRCVLGMFDVSARPCVSFDTLSFAIPIQWFAQMVANMDESFLIAESWEKIRQWL